MQEHILELIIIHDVFRFSLFPADGFVTIGEVKALIDKRFKAHVIALGRDAQHAAATAMAAEYTVAASKVGGRRKVPLQYTTRRANAVCANVNNLKNPLLCSWWGMTSLFWPL